MKPIYCKDCKYFKMHKWAIYECRKKIETTVFDKITGLTEKNAEGLSFYVANQDNDCKYFESKKR